MSTTSNVPTYYQDYLLLSLPSVYCSYMRYYLVYKQNSKRFLLQDEQQ